MKANMIRKLSEVIQKQINQSLNIQKQSFKDVLKKGVLKYVANLQENTYAKVCFLCRCKGLLLKTYWTLKNLDPAKPEPRKTWTLKIMVPKEIGPWKK